MPATEIPMFRCMIAAALVLLPAAAFADKQTAAACAGKLTPEAKLIYDTAAPT
jgi:hypothetical protein